MERSVKRCSVIPTFTFREESSATQQIRGTFSVCWAGNPNNASCLSPSPRGPILSVADKGDSQ